MVSNCGIITILQAIIHAKDLSLRAVKKFDGGGNVNVNIFVQTQHIFNIEVSLAPYYNSPMTSICQH